MKHVRDYPQMFDTVVSILFKLVLFTISVLSINTYVTAGYELFYLALGMWTYACIVKE